MSKLTKEIVNERLLERGIQMKGNYHGGQTKTEFQCQEGHVWHAMPSQVMFGKGCPHCSGTAALTKDIINKRLIDKGITLIGDYTNARTKTEFMCSSGHIWEANPNKVLHANGCPHCTDTKLTKDVVNARLLSNNKEITMVGGYSGAHCKTEFQCSHGHTWMASPNNVLRRSGCPHCAESGFDPDKPAWVYGWTRNNYLKVGITNDLSRRLAEHRKHGEINLVYERHYPVGRHARLFEQDFKRTHGGSYVTREECPDGYTETFPLHLLGELTQ